jgi:hypothetical protein
VKAITGATTTEKTSDGDGVGDTPYVLGTNNTDRYPLMNPVAIPAVSLMDQKRQSLSQRR